MNRFIDFLSSYYDYIIMIISCLLTIISFILKYKSNNKNKKVLSIFQILPAIILEAEQVFKDVKKCGSNKKAYVLQKLETICNQVDINYDFDFWDKKIEDFLSCPQKK